MKKRNHNLTRKKMIANHQVNKNHHSQPYMNRKQKQLLVAVFSSLFIGIVFGLMTLQMSKLEDQQPATILNATAPEKESDEKKMRQTPSFSIYLVQSGVFREAENAQQLEEEILNQQYPAVNWQRNNEYYVLAGIAESKESAIQQAEELDEHGIDAFVKAWDMENLDVKMTEVDNNWLQLFLQQWKISLQASDNGTGIMLEDWMKLLEDSSELSTSFQTFQQSISETVKLIENKNIEKNLETQFLLQILMEYDKLLNF